MNYDKHPFGPTRLRTRFSPLSNNQIKTYTNRTLPKILEKSRMKVPKSNSSILPSIKKNKSMLSMKSSLLTKSNVPEGYPASSPVQVILDNHSRSPGNQPNKPKSKSRSALIPSQVRLFPAPRDDQKTLSRSVGRKNLQESPQSRRPKQLLSTQQHIPQFLPSRRLANQDISIGHSPDAKGTSDF